MWKYAAIVVVAVVSVLLSSQTNAFTSNSCSVIGKCRHGSFARSYSKHTSQTSSRTSTTIQFPETGTATTKKSKAAKVLLRTMVSFVVLQSILNTQPAFAKTVAAAETHLHLGQKIANFFRLFGIPDLGVLAIISALPVVELRGAIPVGIWMGLPITTVLPVCVFGNMIPILPILLLLRNKRLTKLMGPILKRAEKKTVELGIGSKEKQWASLAAFVGIPLPGTGAWTGAMGAFLLGMPVLAAMSSIFAGVTAAGIIMSAITLGGKAGGIAAMAALCVLTSVELFKGEKKQNF